VRVSSPRTEGGVLELTEFLHKIHYMLFRYIPVPAILDIGIVTHLYMYTPGIVCMVTSGGIYTLYAPDYIQS
jgi:hypothetical protein